MYLIVLKSNYCKYTLNILHLRLRDPTILTNSGIKTHLGLIALCNKEVLQNKFELQYLYQ